MLKPLKSCARMCARVRAFCVKKRYHVKGSKMQMRKCDLRRTRMHDFRETSRALLPLEVNNSFEVNKFKYFNTNLPKISFTM